MSEARIPAQGPADVNVRPLAWADDKAMAGQVGNVASAAAKAYWERSDWVDRETAKRLRHPLFALGPGTEYVRITRVGDRFTVEVEGMAKVEVDAMSHDPRDMLLATLAEMLMGPNVEVTGAARLYRAASGGPQGVRPAWARCNGVKVPCGSTDMNS